MDFVCFHLQRLIHFKDFFLKIRNVFSEIVKKFHDTSLNNKMFSFEKHAV